MRSWRTSEAGALGRLYAWCVVVLRWPIVLGWAVAVAAAVFWMPVTTEPADLGGFAPPDSKAIATERASAEAFGFPLLSRTVLVQRDEAAIAAGYRPCGHCLRPEYRQWRADHGSGRGPR